MVSDTRVRVRIEADKATGAIQVVTDELKKFGDEARSAGEGAKEGAEGAQKMGEATEQLDDTIKKLLSTAAITAFFKMAVEESLKEAEALRTLQSSLEATGQSWARYRDEVEAYAKTQQETTRFDDTVTFEVLGKMARATKSVQEAMQATTLAQNLAVATNKPLAETTEIINGLLLGQTRAVASANKEFGIYAAGATTAQQALDNLQRGVRNAAAEEHSATKTFSQFRSQLGDLIQSVGDAVVPALGDMATAINDIIRKTKELLDVNAKQKDELQDRVKLLTEERDALVRSAVSLSSHGAVTAETAAEEERLRQAIKLKNAELDDAVRKQEAAGKKEREQNKLSAQEGLQDREEAAQKRADLEQRFSEQTAASIEGEFELKRQKLEEEIALAEKVGVDKVTIEAYRSTQTAEIFKQETAAKAKELKAQEKLDDERKKNFASTLQFISTLSTAKNAELRAIGKAGSLASAYINTAEAVTKALASAPPPFNFLLAGAVGAAGAAQIAVIAGVQLEKGGVVAGSPDGITATIGEKGKKEAVIPLTDPRALSDIGNAIARAGGSGVGAGEIVVININVNASVPDWRVILEGIAEEASKQTPEIISVARRLGDLNERFSGRSS